MTGAAGKARPARDTVPQRAPAGDAALPAGERPLVSVVTPAYNEEENLRECIESVLAQTYPNWDMTIVNNCSTDRTLAIAQEYAARDRRIRVHSNETFVDVIANHNIAFRQIAPEAKYCKLVAADDWIFPDCLEKMVALAERHPSVAIVSAYKIFGESLVNAGLPFPREVAPGREVCRYQLSTGPYLLTASTSLLFRADVVRRRHAFYPEPHLHADAEACLDVLRDNDFGFVHQVLTFARERQSLAAIDRQLNKFLSHRLDFLQRYGPTFFGAEELAQCTRDLLREYHAYLGSQCWHARGAAFWKFHREQLARLHCRLNVPRVLLHAALHACEALARRLRRYV